ncbi:MAG: sulfite oxidase-like oxidoreductase [Candidatus Nanopelagicales bacterium]
MAREAGLGERSGVADRLPPGQYAARGWPVQHYGRVPRFDPATWDFQVAGATRSGAPVRWTYERFAALPRVRTVADFHCVTKFSILDVEWTGVPVTAVLDAAPPADDVSHVLVWAEYGYSTNLRLSDLRAPAALLATHRDGEPLAPEHGWPLRLVVPHLYAWKGAKWVRGLEYLTQDRRGFWEERGYHNRAEVWAEERFSYQEEPGDGPPLAPARS